MLEHVRRAHASGVDRSAARQRRAQRAARVDADWATILVAAQAGGSWAMEKLYRAVAPSLSRYLRARIGQDADDVAASTWLDVARNLTTFDGNEDAFRAWVFTIANRRLTDHLRRSGRRPLQAVLDDAATSKDHSASAEDAALAGDLGDEAARQIVAALPPEQAEVVLLRVVGGLSVDEVAELVGRRPGHVRVLQHRALRRLAEVLPEDL